MEHKNKLSIQVEGWRGISHSYALVNQFQLLHWRKSCKVSVSHVDKPFIMQHWVMGENSAGFHPEDMSAIDNISQATAPEAVYRIFAPFGLDTPVDLPTVTFAVTEFGLNDGSCNHEVVKAYCDKGGKIHTPSKWSKKRLIASGIPENIIYVIPHSADPNYFYQIEPDLVTANRKIIGYQPDDVIILNVGTHHWNKGLDVLIKGFAHARRKNKNLKLLLKDQRSTYLMNSESYVHEVLSEIGMSDAETFNAIKFLSGHLNLSQLNMLYNVVDAYVTPYRAEGFNLPAFEAQACGTPVIATYSGATQDFLSESRNLFIPGQYFENVILKEGLTVNAYIEPDLTSLISVLEVLDRKKINSFPHEFCTWGHACNEIAYLLTN